MVTRTIIFFITILLCIPFVKAHAAVKIDSRPPEKPVKLVFIHHSCGENWLSDNNGRLGLELAKNNYFVSDTNYGWGPESIGDRTDITDWPEWFTSTESKRYLKALYNESGQHSNYTRTFKDPEGPNRIIIFKSCFPNSNMEGRPDSRPARGDGLTVSNAKAIYNELLKYFAARPDKLFIAITAPPVLDRTYSKNARAFNTWLTKEWLSSYKGNNVAIFDFYNILTGPKNHHRIINGKIEYITDRGKDTLYYPTGSDEHPSSAGNRKATKEFVPLLNHYYNLWAPHAPQQPARGTVHTRKKIEKTKESPPVKSEVADQESKDSDSPSELAKPGETIDDFEGTGLKWVVFSDEGKDTRLVFQRDTGMSHKSKAGMRIEYDIAPDSWATCSFVYPSPRDMRKTKGIELYLHAENSLKEVAIVAYQGRSSDELKHFEFKAKPGKKGLRAWEHFKIPWDQFIQPSWQGDRNIKFDPGKSMGFAFAVVSSEKKRNKGVFWVDDLRFLDSKP
jgi:hypothetical protein